MLPHDNYIMHFNKNHDPRNGQFAKGSGGSSFNTSSKSVNNKNKLIPNAKYLKNYSGPAYFISEEKLSGSLKPRIPNNYFTKNGFEDSKTPRVSFAPSIDKCLAGLSQNVEGKIYYVYSPKDISKCEVYKPNSKAVPDSKITDELWITNPVEIAQVGKIKVTGNQGKDGKRFSYGNKTAELYDDWIYENLNGLRHDGIEKKEGDSMLPHDNYIMHFNKNHDPRNGQFTKGHGGSVSKSNVKNKNVKRKTSKESTNEQIDEDKPTNVSELSDKELIKKIERAKLEKEYKTLTGDTLNKQGSNYLKNFIPQMTDKVLFPLLDTGIKIAVETLLHDNYMPYDNYLMHFNKNHDPRNGQFTKGSGGSISSTSSKKSNSSKKSDSNSSKSADKKKAEEYIKKHPDQEKYITIGDDGRMRFDVMRWQIDEDLKQASGRLIRKKTTTTAATTRKENTTTTKTENDSEIRKKALIQTGKKVGQIIGGIALAGLIGKAFDAGRSRIFSQGDAERLGKVLIREIARGR